MDKLRELQIQEFNQKHPAYPEYLSKPIKKFNDKSSNNITQAILKFLRLNGHQAERVSNTGRPMDTRQLVTDVVGFQKLIGSIKWIPGNGQNGTADISATIKGKSVKIEIKYGPDKQSDAQKDYQRQVELAGGIYYIAKDFESFYRWYLKTFNYEAND